MRTVVIKLGKWDSAYLAKYVYERIYVTGYKWTPLCWRTNRNQWRNISPWTAHWNGKKLLGD